VYHLRDMQCICVDFKEVMCSTAVVYEYANMRNWWSFGNLEFWESGVSGGIRKKRRNSTVIKVAFSAFNEWCGNEQDSKTGEIAKQKQEIENLQAEIMSNEQEAAELGKNP
jgi:hypothetical protein